MAAKQLTFEEAIEFQQEQWSSGDRVLVEELLARCPQANSSVDLQLDLIYGEILQREGRGESLEEDEFIKRFPNLAPEIARQFQIHRAIGPMDEELYHDTPHANLGETIVSRAPVRDFASQLSIPGFEVIETIGRGGAGIAFKARDLKLGRMVAIKLINSVLSLDAESQKRFLREAESAASLQHPSIVPVYQIGETESGAPFLVMALVEGDSLVSKVRSGPMPARDAVALMIPIVEAVNYAHQQGIIHRDIKPGNILLNKEDQPFVCDFGLAKRIDAEHSMNATGSIVGTPAYMPPEQAKGASTDGRSDVYSLGVLLYELLSGRSPFQAPSIWETLQHVLNNDAVLLRQLNPALDRDLETICQRCMEKAPSARYDSAQELLDELKRHQRGEPILARPVGPVALFLRWARREPKLAALAGLVALMGIVLTAVITIAAIRVRDANSETMAFKNTATEARVEALINALPDAVPLTIENLDRSDPKTGKRLSEIADDPSLNPVPRLNASLGLASLEDYRPTVVADCLGSVPMRTGVCRNIVNAFSGSPDEFLSLVRQRGQSGEPLTDFRFANVALFLGDAELAKKLTKLDADPGNRILFIHQFNKWHGDPEYFSRILQNETDWELLSAVCIAIAKVNPDGISEKAKTETVKALRSLFQQHDSGAVHSAAEWALNRWKSELPELIATQQSSGASKRWRLTDSEHIMIRMDPVTAVLGGFFENQNLRHEVTITIPFEIASKEVTIAEFQQFVDSLDVDDELSKWEHHQKIGPHVDCPAQQLTWVEALRYCNWLSEREGFEPCYQQHSPSESGSDSQPSWSCNFSASGYRLPTEAEWEYAGRAKSETSSTFGGDPSIAVQHVQFSHDTQDASLPVGSLIPNGFGLFDVEGNVWEWCWDQYAPLDGKSLVDPRGPDETRASDFEIGRLNRGGGVHTKSGLPYVCGRGYYNGLSKATNIGIRVARTIED